MNQLTIFCLILGVVSWYYFNKFQDSEKEYNKLYKRFEQVYIENQKVKSRIKDLQSYKNDISKTFKILDNELVMINDHLKKQNENVTTQRQRPTLPPRPSLGARSFYMRNIPNNNVSLLTPDLLTSLFNMNTLDIFGNNSTQEQNQEQTQEQTQEQMQEQMQEQIQEQTQELNVISKEQDQKIQEQIQELEQEQMQEQTQEGIETTKLDLNIDIDRIGRVDILSGNGDNYDKYIM